MILQVWEDYNQVFYNQKIFRLLLDCMARPGKINLLPQPQPPGDRDYSFLLHIAGALLDNEVSFACLNGEETGFAAEIVRSTGARPVKVEQADFIFCDGREKQAGLFLANPGTLQFPDTGATVIMTINQLSDKEFAGCPEFTRVELTGPGVNGKRQVWLAGIHQDNLKWLALQNREYPLGADAVLVDREGRIACVPRSGKLTGEVAANELCCG